MSAGVETSVRREGAGEVRWLALAVLVLLVGAYLSWTKKDEAAALEKVNISELAPDRISELVWITRTQTVTVSRKKSASGEAYVWFDVKTRTARGFKGNKSTSTLFESFAPFAAVRSLGTALSDAQLADMKLARPEQKLILRTGGADKTYEVGGRTFGSRDWYLRAAGGKEVFVVASRVLQDLEFAEGKYMQRDLTLLDKKDVTGVVLKAGPKEVRFLQQNRLSPNDAFWTRADAPDAKDEAVGNFLRKLEGLKASSYAEPAAVEGATKVLELTWQEDDKPKESMALYRTGETGKEKYLVLSDATTVPVEVPRSTAEQVEQDLAGIVQ